MGHYDDKGNAIVGNIAIPASHVAELRELLSTPPLPGEDGWYVNANWEPGHSSVFRRYRGEWTEITPNPTLHAGVEFVAHASGKLVALVPASSVSRSDGAS